MISQPPPPPPPRHAETSVAIQQKPSIQTSEPTAGKNKLAFLRVKQYHYLELIQRPCVHSIIFLAAALVIPLEVVLPDTNN